jgi:hypothetical protein
MIKKFRDISLMNLGSNTLTIACDSCAGVGMLSEDIIKADAYITGYRTAFVSLAETLSLGSATKLLVNTLSVSMDEYGQNILNGIYDAAKQAGLSGANVITGSTEDNFSVPVTSLGITVIGELEKELPSPIEKELFVYLAGMPKSGAEVLSSVNEILTFRAIRKIIKSFCPADFIPVGSKGIAYELGQMELALNAVFSCAPATSIDMNKSAGPATCAIFACEEISSEEIMQIDIPVKKIGTIIPK